MIKSKTLKAFICFVLVACLLSTSIYAYPSAETAAAKDSVSATGCNRVADDVYIDDGLIGGGDVNGNGIVSAADAMLTLRAAIGLINLTQTQKEAADTDYNNFISVIDALKTLQAASGLITLEYRYKASGMYLGPYVEEGQVPGSTVLEEQLHNLIDGVVPYTEWILVENNGVSFGQVPHDHGLKVAMSINNLKNETGSLDNVAANRNIINNVISIGSTGQLDCIIIGQNCLSNGFLTEVAMISRINKIKTALPGIQVGVAETSAGLLAHQAVIDACDQILLNVNPFNQGVSVDQAVASIYQSYNSVLSVTSKPIILSGMGWPSLGDTVALAIPSPENSAYFFKDFISMARKENIQFFYFEGYDEAWRSVSTAADASYGIWDSSKNIKNGMLIPFNGYTVADNWTT